MPTFAQFFTLDNTADDFQKRVYEAIKNTKNIVECYLNMYAYIVLGLKWSSREARYALMDNTVDQTGFGPNEKLQMDDARTYFEGGELSELTTRVFFEYLDIVPQDSSTYGANVFNLVFRTNEVQLAVKAWRQVRFYSQVQIYNDEYATQLAYRNNNPTIPQPPPNGPIDINPATPLDPDARFAELTNRVTALEQWIVENHLELKTVQNATDLNKLVFDSVALSFEDKSDAIDTMLEKIRCLGKNNAATRKGFGMWVIKQLEAQQAFWNKPAISKYYAEIIALKRQFDKNATKNLKIYEHFKELFADFLDTTAVDLTALSYIKKIFTDFTGSGVSARVISTFNAAMGRALAQIKSDYQQEYTSNLAMARKAVPTTVNPILSGDLADVLKAKADECLRTLPLLSGQTQVRFFTIQNYEDLKALNDKSVNVLKGHELYSSAVVPADPSESDGHGGTIAWPRPIYRSIRFLITKVDEYIAFCNLPHLPDGTFYYRHVQSPAVITIPTTNGPSRILTIDFQNYTITYPGKKQPPNKNDAGEAYRSLGSTKGFYAEIKNTTKWTTLSAVRRYDPYYVTNSATPGTPDVHLTAFVAAGRGLARALPLGNEDLCLWWRDAQLDPWNKLGPILGLPERRKVIGDLTQMHVIGTPCVVQVDGKQYDFNNYGPLRLSNNKFYYQVIGLSLRGLIPADEQFYVRVNTPIGSVAQVLTGYKQTIPRRTGRPLEDDPRALLSIFDFCYYRRITSDKDPVTGVNFTENSKVIQLYKKGDKRRPTQREPPIPGLADWSTDLYEAIGANLPICFNLPENIIEYYLDKQSRGKIINKGNSLYREQKPRKDASAAMKPIYRLLKPPVSPTLSAAKLPATAFSNSAMTQSLSVREDWGTIKLDSSNYVPINQEWCHLRGHGDGGDEYPGNFVSGSYHCNTEQLSIEDGQRLVTQQMPERSFVLHTTAYLLRDAKDYKSSVPSDSDSQILIGNYLDDQNTYQSMLNNHIARRSRELGITDPNQYKKRRIDASPPKQGAVAPVAAYVRYKVMRSEEQTTQAGGQTTGNKRTRDETTEKRSKYFDFIFEGQSEFLDVHQFAIARQAVWFALAGGAAFTTWYTQAKADLEAKATTT